MTPSEALSALQRAIEVKDARIEALQAELAEARLQYVSTFGQIWDQLADIGASDPQAWKDKP